jgi:phage protein D/phage baseplate assembly protein gpV
MADAYAAKPGIELNGTQLDPEVQLRLERAAVDDHTILPDMFVLRFRDPERDLIDKAGFEIGATVRILAAPQGDEAREPLITGEVTALEADFDSSGSHTVVRGYDHSHRLHRGRRTETYRNVTDSDVARTVAQRAGLEIGRIDETTAVHRQVSQANVSDWEFLAARARESGHEFAIVGGKFEFREPAEASAGPESGDLASEDPLQLVLGADLDSFRPRVTSAEQVKEVLVSGWNPDNKEVVTGRAEATTASASLSVTAADLASKFGDPTYSVVDVPLSTQDEVDSVAKATAEQIASSFAEAEGVARGNPKLKAGAAISVGLAGSTFDGLYTITSARHVFDREGYKTHVSVTGRQLRSLLGLASQTGTNGPGRQRVPPIAGVVPALVTNVSDSQDLARVKLSFPWLSDTYESDWTRVVQDGAGNERGFVVLPEVNDEVLVAFEHGDIRRPYVVGGLYNGKDVPKLGDGFIDKDTGEVKLRGFVSRKGHSLVFLDGSRDEGITLVTGDDGLRIALDKSNTTIHVESNGDVKIEAKGDVSVSGKELSFKAQSGVSIDGGGGNVTIKGTQIRLN